MTRNRASAKKAGTSQERLVADYFRDNIIGGSHIDRRAKTGNKDKGDLGGIQTNLRTADEGWRMRIVAEVKNTMKLALGTWIGEAETERLNDTDRFGEPAGAAIVIHKRHGKAAAGDQLVTMTARDFVAILNSERPHE